MIRYCTSVAVLLGEGEVVEPMEEVWEAVVAAVVDDVWEINVVAIAEIEVIPSADSLPGTHWSMIRPHYQYTIRASLLWDTCSNMRYTVCK